MTRGDIVLVSNPQQKTTGHEQHSNRPAIVVSNNICNRFSPVVEIVYLTTSQTKNKLPTHVMLENRKSIALCEAVYSIDKCRIYKVCERCTPSEMEKINHALKISLGLEQEFRIMKHLHTLLITLHVIGYIFLLGAAGSSDCGQPCTTALIIGAACLLVSFIGLWIIER